MDQQEQEYPLDKNGDTGPSRDELIAAVEAAQGEAPT